MMISENDPENLEKLNLGNRHGTRNRHGYWSRDSVGDGAADKARFWHEDDLVDGHGDGNKSKGLGRRMDMGMVMGIGVDGHDENDSRVFF